MKAQNLSSRRDTTPEVCISIFDFDFDFDFAENFGKMDRNFRKLVLRVTQKGI